MKRPKPVYVYRSNKNKQKYWETLIPLMEMRRRKDFKFFRLVPVKPGKRKKPIPAR